MNEYVSLFFLGTSYVCNCKGGYTGTTCATSKKIKQILTQASKQT